MRAPLYTAEKEAGLAEAILAPRPVVLAGAVELSAPFVVNEHALSRLTEAGQGRARANEGQLDLHYLKTVLVTAGWDDTDRGVPAGWNLNDDFFDPFEVWSARATPEDKPVNFEHDCADIIGHVTANRAVDDAGADLPDDSLADGLPGKLHLTTSSVLYKMWERPELQERMDRTLAEIADGKWRVSMECLFRGFDYVVLEGGKATAVARNGQTAFMTRHLRAYGGDGTYQGKRVARFLRNVVFSGQALVKKPANPESVIINSASASSGNSHSLPVSGYQLTTGEARLESEREMATETEAIQKELVAVKAENEGLKAQLRDSDVKQVTKAREAAEAEVVELKKKLAESAEAGVKLVGDRKAAQDELAEAKAKLSEVSEAHQAVAAELGAIQAEQKKAERLAKVKAALKVDDKDAEAVKAAEAFSDSLAELSEEKFDAHVQAVAKFTPAKLPPKSTPAKSPPQSTNKPAPMAGKASATDLETATVATEAALATEADAGAESVRSAVAEYFGCPKDE